MVFYYTLGPVLSAGARAVNKTDKISYAWSLYFCGTRHVNKSIRLISEEQNY